MRFGVHSTRAAKISLPIRLIHIVAAALFSTGVRSADELRIRQVEQGLLPIAATEPGVPTNIEDRMRAYGVPGLSIAVVDGGKIAWAKGYGLADSASGRPVTTGTLFQAASISKPISAMGVLLLVQQGRLRLDESANEALKIWKIPENDFTRTQPVTVRMMLNHTDGLEHASPDAYTPFSMGERLPSILQILRGKPPARSGAVTVIALPGKSFAYSGAGYEALEQLIIDVSGQPFERFMQANVLAPLGMTSSTFAQPLPPRLQSTASTGYYAGGEPLPGRFRVNPELTVAGLWTTPTDIARYIVNVQKTYAGLAHGPLAEAMAREMLVPGLGNRGLGPAISGSGRSARFGHDGFNEGFESSFIAYEHDGRGAVVMANSSFAFMLIKEVLGSISRVYGWNDYGATTQQPPFASMGQQKVISVTPAILAAAAGRYIMGNITITLARQGKRLLLDWPGNGVTEVFAVADGRLFCPALTFSDLGSPWLRLVQSNGLVTRILAGDDAGIELSRAE